MNGELALLEKEFRRMNHCYRRSMRVILSRNGLYHGQPPILFTLLNAGGCTQKDISKRLDISQATVAVSIRRLLKAGFISKTPDQKDLRRNRIELTEFGKETANACRKQIDLVFERMYAGFDENEIRSLTAIFQKLSENLCG